MEIVHDESELIRYMSHALDLHSKHPILVDKYLEGKEVEVDAVCDGESVLIPGVMEHIERAGVHSGDSIAVYPAINLSSVEINTIVDYTVRIGLALKVIGLMNVQMVIVRDRVGNSSIYILEVNPRASRTIPFISKVTDIPMVKLATKIMLGISLKQQSYETGLCKRKKLIAIKAPVFSMSKLSGVDTYLGPEMKSTGEVMGIDLTYEAALTKALIAAGLMLPSSGSILFSIADKDKQEAMPIIKGFYSLGYKLYATEGTASAIEMHGMKVEMIGKKLGKGHPNVVDMIQERKVHAVLNTVTGGRESLQDGFEIRRTATEMRIPCFTSLDTARVVWKSLTGSSHIYNIKPLQEYLSSNSRV